ncbi:hypothetical protein SGUI_0791 [Serinicoccus hydrothermalis]|uniref:Uncharacterized protein n=1 Tax=Serinicoccus hydrothermalis TaxID=1758689 RepID=A0A1B1N9S5_9MICO|nr:hypothetical protein SGUI_0791 [Serinicoccus hydrothermalis]
MPGGVVLSGHVRQASAGRRQAPGGAARGWTGARAYAQSETCPTRGTKTRSGDVGMFDCDDQPLVGHWRGDRRERHSDP